MSVENLITEHLDVWTSAIKTRSAAGRGNSKKLELVGIKKLRELILELAVRGKLVLQDPNDHPASELLNNIKTEKAQLVKQGEIKKQKTPKPISDEEKLFDLPSGWEWAFLGELSSDIHYGYTASAQAEKVGTRLLRITDIQDDKVDWGSVPGCEISDKKSEVYLLKDNDILIARTGGTIGKSYLVENIDVKAVFASYLIRVKRISTMYSPYIKTYLGSSVYWKQLYDNASGTGQPNVNATALKQLLVPIPPLSQQHRIVAKVDELMILCDQLEAQTENSIQAHQLLVETLLATLSNAKDADGLNDNWQRISQHFDVLFTTQYSIDQLKQTILQLAVMGKLVKQDPADEPAAKLLERIVAEKEQLVKEGEIKKTKPLPQITEEEKPFDTPDGWEFVRFGNLTSKLGSGSTPRGGKSAYVEKGIIFLRSQNVWNDGLRLDDTAYITVETNQKMQNTQVFPGDVLLNITGASLGRSTIFPEHLTIANVSQHVTIIRLIEESMSFFVHLGIQSPIFQNLVWGRQVGMAIEGLSKKVLELFEFPVPPIEEQKRIIAKVDELMSLCQSLQDNINHNQSVQLKITETLVRQEL
ncbi:MAG: restriction endonuclease subunit S [Glaciecola sp.]